MISIILVDYKTADRCVKYISDFIKAVNVSPISFVIVDNSPFEDNRNQMLQGLKSKGFSLASQINTTSVQVKDYFCLSKGGLNVVYVSTGENAGFAKANNLGSLIAKQIFSPKYLLFSNSDIQLPTNLKLSLLVLDLQENPNWGMVGPKVVGLDGKAQSPGRFLGIYKRHIVPELLWPLHKLIPHLKKINYDVYSMSKKSEVYRIIGAFMFAKADMFWEIGGFDEKTFLYAEEPIISERYHQHSLVVGYDPDVEIIHEQGVSTNDSSKNEIHNIIVKRKRAFESELYYYEKYIGYSSLTIRFARIFFEFYVLKISLFSKIKRD